MQRDVDSGFGSTTRRSEHHEREVVAVQLTESRSGVAKTDALDESARETNAVVRDAQRQTGPARDGGDADGAPGAPRLEPMAERVLDQRLQEERRHECVEQSAIDVDGDRKTVAISHPVELDVAVEH